MILALGTVTLDTVESGGTAYRDMPGGSALFFAAAAAPFARVRVVGAVGPDYPTEVLSPLRRVGVDLDGIRTSPVPTQRWHARYGREQDERITVASDRRILEGFRPTLEPAETKARFVFLGSIDPDIQRHVLDQVGDPTLVALDSMSHWIESKSAAIESLLSRVTVVLGTEAEVCSLGADSDWRTGAQALLALGPQVVAVKRGRRGACLVTRDGEVWEDATPTGMIDPTGAGDAFAGGLIGRMTAGGSTVGLAALSAALVEGVRAGAKAVSDLSWSGLIRD